jgi:hypothetical protein
MQLSSHTHAVAAAPTLDCMSIRAQAINNARFNGQRVTQAVCEQRQR